MSRILKRPMFRKGGMAGEGIMSKVEPRQGYNLGKQVVAIEEQIRPLYEKALQQQRDDTLANFLTRGGLNLIAGSDKDVSTLQALSGAYRQPLEQAIKARRVQDQMQTQGRLASLGAAVKIASAKPQKGFASQTFAEQVKNKQNFYKGSALTPKVALKFSRNAIKEVRAERALGTKFYGPVDKIESATAIAKQSPDGTVFLDVDRASYFMVKDNKVIPVTFEQAVEFNTKK